MKELVHFESSKARAVVQKRVLREVREMLRLELLDLGFKSALKGRGLEFRREENGLVHAIELVGVSQSAVQVQIGLHVALAFGDPRVVVLDAFSRSPEPPLPGAAIRDLHAGEDPAAELAAELAEAVRSYVGWFARYGSVADVADALTRMRGPFHLIEVPALGISVAGSQALSDLGQCLLWLGRSEEGEACARIFEARRGRPMRRPG